MRGTSLQLCGRKKYVDEILEDNSNNVVSKRLWWNAKAQTFHVDIIIERDVTTSDGSKIIASMDPGITPIGVYVTTDGKVLFASSTEPLVRFEKKIGCLVKKIAKRHFLFVNPGHKKMLNDKKRFRKAYRGRTRALKRKLFKMRQRFRRFRRDFLYGEIKRIFDFCDILILNRLRVTDIAHKSKEEGSTHLSRAGRSKMYKVAPSTFHAMIEHVARRTQGKKVVKGGGERGTSKTCTLCGAWNQALGMKKWFVCSRCGLQIHRDINGAINNLKEVLNLLFELDGSIRQQPQPPTPPPPPPPPQGEREVEEGEEEEEEGGAEEEEE